MQGQGPYGQPAAGPPPYGQGPAGPPPYAPPTSYGPPPYGWAPYPRKTNVLAILALVFAFVFSPAAIVLGVVARRQIRQTGEDGDGLALGGLIIGIVFTALYVLMLVLFFGVFVFAVQSGVASSGAVATGPA